MTVPSYVGQEIEPLPGATLVTKKGGVPSGFEFERWPTCCSCDKRQTFLVQIDLHSPLKIARSYRWAFVFACDDIDCDPFLDDSGANAVIMVTDTDAITRTVDSMPPNVEATSPERHLLFQAVTEDEEYQLDRPEFFLGFAPDYHFPSVSPCLHCEGEMNVIAQFTYDGNACFITKCKAECRDDAAGFMW